MADRAPEKRERLTAVLDRGMAMIHLDARCTGVRVPEHLCCEAHLRLNLSYRFDPPDLSLTDWGIRATLSFSGRRFPVGVPWTAIFAIASHATQEFWTYPEDMPPELLKRATEAATAPPLRPALQQVSAPQSEGESPSPPGRRHLRVVK
jgi:stringent starvation protein B